MSDYIVITPFFPSKESFRGSYIFDQVNAIQSNSNYKLTVVILCSIFDKSYGNYHIDGINCKTFRIIDFPSFILPGFFNIFNKLRFNIFLKKQGVKPNYESIVHGHINYPSHDFLIYFSKKYKCKTILQHHGLDILQSQTGSDIPLLKKIQNKFILRRFINLSSKVSIHIAVSSIVKLEILKINPLLKNRIYVCINGVDTSKFYILSNNNKENKRFVIGCVANFWVLKDQITLLKAINILKKQGLKNIHVKFVGDGKTKKHCIAYAKTHRLDCEFINELEHDKLLYFYNNLNVFVLPSFYEAFGCVYLEALACGVPFIGVKKQGIEDVIPADYKPLQLISRESPEELSKLILYFYSNKTEIRFDEEYTIENTVAKMLNHIKQQGVC